MLENIIALITAIAPIVGSSFFLWRRFVARDMLIHQQENALAIAEQSKLRQAQQAQNDLLTKIIDGSEASMEAVISVINTFTIANAERDRLHEQESKRDADLLATLNDTIKQGHLQHSSDLQALTQAITTFGNKVNEVVEGVERIETTINKTAVTINTLASLVEQELSAVKTSIDKLSKANGKLVTHEQVVGIQTLFENKVDDIMTLLKPENISHLPISKKKQSDEPIVEN